MAVNPIPDGGLRAVIGMAPGSYAKVTNTVTEDATFEIHTFDFFLVSQEGTLAPVAQLVVKYSLLTGYFAEAERTI